MFLEPETGEGRSPRAYEHASLLNGLAWRACRPQWALRPWRPAWPPPTSPLLPDPRPTSHPGVTDPRTHSSVQPVDFSCRCFSCLGFLTCMLNSYTSCELINVKHIERLLACSIAVVVPAIEMVTPGRTQTSGLLEAQCSFSVTFSRYVRR